MLHHAIICYIMLCYGRVVWARGCVKPRGGLSEGMRKASLGCGVVRARGCVKPRGGLGKGMRKAAGWFERGDA